MGMAKRVILFILVNMLVIITVSVLMSVLGVQPYLSRAGINYQALLIFCGIWGMGGAFISLALSRMMAKWLMGVQLIDKSVSSPELQSLVNTVERLAKTAKLPVPEIGVFQSADVNAFATGPSKSRSLVAVSTGLIDTMTQAEIEGVIAHELAHIANGDMVTMTLLQGVINAFVMFFARAVAFAVMQLASGDDEEGGLGGFGSYIVYMILVVLLEIVFMVLGSIVVNAFSRWREFGADARGAKLAGREKMIAALKRLQTIQGEEIDDSPHPAYKSMQISSHSSWFALFSTHPPLEKRIQELEKMR